jgi:hypothetical protein
MWEKTWYTGRRRKPKQTAEQEEEHETIGDPTLARGRKECL